MQLLLGLNSNEIVCWKYALGIVMAIGVCFAVYVLIMGLYILARKKKPSAKYWIEVLFISIGLFFSVLTKLLILADIKFNDDYNFDNSVWGYFAYSLSAIYSLVGSLQFEGLPFAFDQLPVWQACLYYGSSIIAGLILLSVITAKASYEIYSLISLRFSRVIDLFSRKNSVYIFNSLTKDSIILAKSIKANDHNSVIIFAGKNIPSFSRIDPLCREIMSNSFYYYSLSSGNDTKHSILKRLKLKRCNLSLLTFDMEQNKGEFGKKIANKSNHKQKRFCEFYFELEENKKPNQEQNTTDAFEELRLIMQDTFKLKKKKKYYNKLTKILFKNIVEELEKDKNADIKPICLNYFYNIAKLNHWCITEHYILTFNESNYAYYTRSVNEKIDEYILGNFELLKRSLLYNMQYLNYKSSEWKKILDNSIEYLNTHSFKDFCLHYGSIDENNNDMIINIWTAFEKSMREFLTASNQIHIVNESYLSSISLVETRSEAIREKLQKEFEKIAQDKKQNLEKEYNENRINDKINYQEKLKEIDDFYKQKFESDSEQALLAHLGYTEEKCTDYKALILGFGGNGQSALNALFYDSAIIDKENNFNGFYADVVDQNIHNLDGTFAKNHPLYRCFTSTDDTSIPMENAEKEYAKRKNLIQSDDIENSFKFVNNGKAFINKYDMTFPLVQFHNKSCNSLDFINFFDSVTGSEGESIKHSYNIIVISFGSDRENINIANTIIDDIRREYFWNSKDNQSYVQCIAVNIRDADNLNKLNWSDEDKREAKLHGITVFSFGAKEDIYSYEKILNYDNQYKFSTNYELMKKHLDNVNVKEKVKVLSEELLKSYNSDSISNMDFSELIKELIVERDFATKNILDRIAYQISYLKLEIIEKEVNRTSAVYENVLNVVIKKLLSSQKNKKSLSFESIRALLKLEHEARCRFYIAHGYTYNCPKNEQFKMHNCLLPIQCMNIDNYRYDLINVIMQWSEIIKNQNDGRNNKSNIPT